VPRRSRRLWPVLALLLCVPARATAHQRGLSQAHLRVGGQQGAPAVRIAVDLVFARPEIVELVPRADADRSGQLDEIELLSVETLLSEQVQTGVEIEVDGRACAGAVERIAFVEEDGLSVAAAFTCEGRAPPLSAFTVRLPLLARLAPGHRLVGHVVFQDMPDETETPELDFVAHRRRAALTVRRPVAAPAPAAAPLPLPLPAPAPWRWLALAAAPLAVGAVWLFRRRRRG
jgi:hypothetical protein